MDSFRTTFAIPQRPSFGYHDAIMLCGSCFVENIGEQLENHCFNTLINPSGILFNPVSLAYSFEDIINNRQYTQEDLIDYKGIYNSFRHHSCLSSPDATQTVRQINRATEEAHHFLKKATILIVTFGTSWAYKYRQTGDVVSSCHKIPQEHFTKEMLSTEDTVAVFSKTTQDILAFNPDIRIVLTVSPVRHIKDGMVENQHSKAVLLLAVKELCERHRQVEYFPAYELLMDDLRDYRFYADDMLHPSSAAIQYIWRRFCKTYFNASALEDLGKAEKLLAASLHRPFHAQSDEFLHFCRKKHEEALMLMQRFPEARFDKMVSFFSEIM